MILEFYSAQKDSRNKLRGKMSQCVARAVKCRERVSFLPSTFYIRVCLNALCLYQLYLSIAAKSKVYHYTEIILTQTQPIVQHILILYHSVTRLA